MKAAIKASLTPDARLASHEITRRAAALNVSYDGILTLCMSVCVLWRAFIGREGYDDDHTHVWDVI